MPLKDLEKRRAYQKKYRSRPEVKERAKEYRKEYYQRPENKKKREEYKKEYDQRPENKKRAKEYKQRPENKKKRKEYKKEYNQRPEIKKKKYLSRKNDPAHKKRNQLRAKVRLAVIHQVCFTSTIHKLIGCDVPTARAHLEAKFEPWMNWENYGCGSANWCIDHITPVVSIDIFNEEEVKRIFHYQNMQPMQFIKNCEKGCSIRRA